MSFEINREASNLVWRPGGLFSPWFTSCVKELNSVATERKNVEEAVYNVRLLWTQCEDVYSVSYFYINNGSNGLYHAKRVVMVTNQLLPHSLQVSPALHSLSLHTQSRSFFRTKQ